MIDKSWGIPGPSNFRVRSNDTSHDRSAQRAKAREERATERAAAMDQRLTERAVNREADAVIREQARTERREAEMQAAAADPHRAAASRHRSSGRKDVVREQRDTRSYTTVVDHQRMRELAKRGASVSGLAKAFGVAEWEVERALADTE